MEANRLEGAVEAVLFAAGEPVTVKRLAEALEIDTESTVKLCENLRISLDERGSGLCLMRMDDSYQLCTRIEFSDCVRSVLEMRRNTPLSKAAFEVLAVIAYNQPVTKAFVEQVRGVDCSGVVSSLTEKGLIEEKGRLDLPGKPIIYGTTPVFLRCFCIESLEELPALPTDEAEETETEVLMEIVSEEEITEETTSDRE